MLNHTVQFVLGGGVIVGMSLLAQHVHPKYAALLYALPIQYTLALIFIHLGTKEGTIQSLVHHTILFAISFVIFVGAFYLLLKRFDFWWSLGFAFVLFFLSAWLILRFV